MERFGLVGLPNAGKSSLYNALTGGGALAAPYPFATKDPNIGVAKVPDERLDRLAEMSQSKNVVHASVEVVDSRVKNWDISLLDTIADNASSGVFTLGSQPRKSGGHTPLGGQSTGSGAHLVEISAELLTKSAPASH